MGSYIFPKHTTPPQYTSSSNERRVDQHLTDVQRTALYYMASYHFNILGNAATGFKNKKFHFNNNDNRVIDYQYWNDRICCTTG